MADFDSSLPVRTEADGDIGSRIVGTTVANVAEVNTNDELLVHDTDALAAFTDGTAIVQVIDANSDALDVNTDGSINVNVVNSTQGDQIHIFDTEVGVAASATPVVVLSYPVNTGKTLLLQYVHASSSGKAKVIVKAGTPTSETIRAVFFISTANGFGFAEFPNRIEVIAGDNVLVEMANLDKGAQDLYAYINGVEVTAP
jgi:hypothetical protein